MWHRGAGTGCVGHFFSSLQCMRLGINILNFFAFSLSPMSLYIYIPYLVSTLFFLLFVFGLSFTFHASHSHRSSYFSSRTKSQKCKPLLVDTHTHITPPSFPQFFSTLALSSLVSWLARCCFPWVACSSLSWVSLWFTYPCRALAPPHSSRRYVCNF